MELLNSGALGFRRAFKICSAGGATLLCLYAASLTHADSPLSADQLIDLPLEALMQMDATVTSVSKRDETLKDSASAIYVLSREDIRRSTATNIPDALRLVPGLQVGQISPSEWAISARGLGGRFARYFLVLIDGRSLYTSLFSGVNWDELQLSLENIESIEVIRGPGGSMWGANAVNGVINIITRNPDAKTSAQVRLTLGDGAEKHSFYGRKDVAFSDNAQAFISADIHQVDAFDPVQADMHSDGLDSRRVDAGWNLRDDKQHFSVKAAAWQTRSLVAWSKQQLEWPWVVPLYSDETKQGYYVSSKWTREASIGEWYLLLNIDSVHRDTTAYHWDDRNYDLEWQWTGELFDRHTLVTGLFARRTESLFAFPAGGLDVFLYPEQSTVNTMSAYIQDNITLADAWLLTLSWRFDKHSLSRIAVQPSLNLLWRPAEHHRFWMSASKSVSTPSRVLNSESRLAIYTFPPTEMQSVPARVELVSEGKPFDDTVLKAYGLGYRFVPSQRFSLDATLFSHHYERLVGTEQRVPPELRFEGATPYYALQFSPAANKSRINSGFELLATYPATSAWMLQYSGSYINVDYGNEAESLSSALARGDEAPEWQHSLRSLWNIRPNTEVDVWLRYVDDLPNTVVKSYLALDAKIAWKLHPDWELSLNGRNLINAPYVEGSRELFNAGDYYTGTSVYLKMNWMPRGE
ncbi:MAG: TonB-dependent receptor [Marinagarivorans sp.]|nr:TonB-dependent receptor [Marinagarivorans sp.]